MSLLVAMGAGVLSAALSAAAPTSNDDISIDKRTVSKLVKGIGKYYEELESERYGRANDELLDLEKQLSGEVDKNMDWRVLLANVEQWREILREGSLPSKAVISSGKAKFEHETRPNPLSYSMKKDEIDALGNGFSGSLHVYVSAPKDVSKALKPVILVLHPMKEEQNVKVKELTRARDILKEVENWVESAYPQEVLDNCIVLAPVMDLARLNEDGLTASRPRWDDIGGITWAILALNDVILSGTQHDHSRIFVDGHGEIGARAAAAICTQFPSMLTGAVIRGEPANNADFRNCRGMPLLFVGEKSKAFADAWSPKEGYKITFVPTLPGAATGDAPEPTGEAAPSFSLSGWITQGDHAKEYAPSRVELYTSEATGAAYWLRLNGFALIDNVRTAEIIGEINRDENRITVTTNPKVRSFIISLNDNLLDLDKEISIVHKRAGAEGEGEVRFKGTVQRSLEDLLKMNFFKSHGNYGEVYLAQVPVDAE